MKFATVLVLALFVCYNCLFPTRALAQTPNTPESCGASDFRCRARLSAPTDASQDAIIQWLIGQVSALERKVKEAGSGGVSREEVRDLRRQLKALEDKVKALSDDLEAHKASQPAASGPSPPPSSSEEYAPWALTLVGRVAALEKRVEDLETKVSNLEDRMSAVERQLRRRAIRFDAGGFFLNTRGLYAYGSTVGVFWPLGQDGDWAIRVVGGAGQGNSLFEGRESLKTPTLLAQGDLLWRIDEDGAYSVGPSISAVWGTVGITAGVRRYVFIGIGPTFRWEPFRWAFLHASLGPGMAKGTYSPTAPSTLGDAWSRYWETWGGSFQGGVSFPF